MCHPPKPATASADHRPRSPRTGRVSLSLSRFPLNLLIAAGLSSFSLHRRRTLFHPIPFLFSSVPLAVIASSSYLRRRQKEQPPTPLDTEATVHFGRRLVSPSIHHRPWEIGDAELDFLHKLPFPTTSLHHPIDLCPRCACHGADLSPPWVVVCPNVSLTLPCCPNWSSGGHGVAPSNHWT
ncbi:uncharacterized protein LOC122056222 [Zingiber officinale]|uniref:uncharacterized protein LOC122056222 n=1 Tax=Zingiber officinale TaxID=94328 RepID=UPI001C4DACA4|nr:uncharacterized protein LOC122056222 [Zingiber officinale]